MASSDQAQPEIPEIGIAALASLRAAGGIRLIDVREPDEYAVAHVPGAVLLPLGTVPERIGEIGEGPLHIICKSGGRSMQAAFFLAAHGIECTNVAGGTDAWVAAGHDVATGDNPA